MVNLSLFFAPIDNTARSVTQTSVSDPDPDPDPVGSGYFEKLGSGSGLNTRIPDPGSGSRIPDP